MRIQQIAAELSEDDDDDDDAMAVATPAMTRASRRRGRLAAAVDPLVVAVFTAT